MTMKKIILSLMLVLATTLGAKAMSYDEARSEALYLTDKMAYELNLNSTQYEYVYEINFDYLLSLDTADDIYGTALSYRLADLRSVLYDWQYNILDEANYFMRPVSWMNNGWEFLIHLRYPNGNYYYSHPMYYGSYRGAHNRSHYSNGFYVQRRPQFTSGFRGTRQAFVGNNVRSKTNNASYSTGRGNGFSIGNGNGGSRRSQQMGSVTRKSQQMSTGGRNSQQTGTGNRNSQQMGNGSRMNSQNNNGSIGNRGGMNQNQDNNINRGGQQGTTTRTKSNIGNGNQSQGNQNGGNGNNGRGGLGGGQRR
jgi:hypothetical protein